MSDYLIKLGQNPWATKAIKTLGLPIPMPKPLRRESSGWRDLLLAGNRVLINQHSLLSERLAAIYRDSGAEIIYPDACLTPDEGRLNTLVLDLTGATDLQDLHGLYSFFHEYAGQLHDCGRAIVIATSPGVDPINTTIAHAAVGFTKSLAKELGKRGCTAQVIYVDPGAESRLDGVVQFLSSPLSAFVSGQVFSVSERVGESFPQKAGKALDGKLALVTGASRGIGYAIAKALANEGAKVVCLDVEGAKESLETLANYISGVPLPVNITSEDVYKKVLAAVPEGYTGYDIVVHNAGITRDKTLTRMTEEMWKQVLDVNLLAVVGLTDRLREKGLNDSARITCLSSTVGIGGNFGQSNYAASKAGLIGYVQSLAEVLAKRGIAVNAVAPGFIETKMTASMPVAVREIARRFNALSQAGRPSDVADVVTFLSSGRSVGLTGQVVRVCGLNYLGA